MRKAIFFGFIVAGVIAGLLASVPEEWPTRIVLMSLGALMGAAIGGALSRVGRHRSIRWIADSLPNDGTSSKDLAAILFR